MINGVTNSSQAQQSYQTQQHQQSAQTHKNSQNDEEPQDTVVLSKKASESSETGNADQDRDSH